MKSLTPALTYRDVVWLRNNYPPAMNYWFRVKEAVKKRESGKCQYCGGIGTEIHHTKYTNVLWHEHIFVDSPDILVWTCRPCHIIQEKKKPKKVSKLINKFQSLF